jgi:phage terminase small subunit
MGFSSRLIAHRHLLTLETLKFIVEYLVDGNATGAALRAGIPETYASRQGQWLKKLPIFQRAMESEVDDRDLRKLQAAIHEIEEKMQICKAILGIEEEL